MKKIVVVGENAKRYFLNEIQKKAGTPFIATPTEPIIITDQSDSEWYLEFFKNIKQLNLTDEVTFLSKTNSKKDPKEEIKTKSKLGKIQRKVLIFLEENEGKKFSKKEISDALDLYQYVAKRALNNLAEKGLIKKDENEKFFKEIEIEEILL